MTLAGWTGLPPDGVAWTDGPDARPGRIPIGPSDLDGDADGAPDTVLVQTPHGLSLFTDLDEDGLADQEVSVADPPLGPSGHGTGRSLLDDLLDLVLGR